MLDLLFNKKRCTDLDTDMLQMEKLTKSFLKSIIPDIRAISKSLKLNKYKAMPFYSPDSIEITDNGSLILNSSQIARGLIVKADPHVMGHLNCLIADLNSLYGFLNITANSYLGDSMLLIYTAKSMSYRECEQILFLLERRMSEFLASFSLESRSVLTTAKWFMVLSSSV